MFTTLLTNLQSYISGRFLVSTVFPMLAFWFCHATMLFFLNVTFHDYAVSITSQQSGLAAVIIGAAFAFVIFLAFVLDALLPRIQSVMEGNNWPSWIASYFVAGQMARYEAVNTSIDENRKLRGMFGPKAGGKTQADLWHGYLTDARQIGTQNAAANNYSGQEDSARLVRELAEKRRRGQALTGDDVQIAVTALTQDLRRNNADKLNRVVDIGGLLKTSTLEQKRQLLWELIDYGYSYAHSQHRLFLTRRQFDFGALPLAPTTMGNVAKSVQSYAIRRYDFNFEQLWSRLQISAQKDDKFSPVLRDAKTQLDFLISCSVLVLLWALPWAIWLYVSEGPPWLFVLTALGGPIASYVLYRAAVAQYRTLANLLKTSIDLFRFDLLNSLHYPQPTGVLEERELWQTIDALHALYEMRDLRYMPPKAS